MGKSSKRSTRSRTTTDRSATTDVVTQLEVAIRNPHAAAIGALIGGLIPWFGRTLAHGEIQDAWSTDRTLALAMIAVVLGCGAFSGLSVYKFGKAAFGDPRKALGFVLALEGVMLVSHGATSAVALAVLILINAVANGSVIALARDASCRRQAAAARSVASRRANRPAPIQSQSQQQGTTPSKPFAGINDQMPHTAPQPTDAPVAVRWNPGMIRNVIDTKIAEETKFLA